MKFTGAITALLLAVAVPAAAQTAAHKLGQNPGLDAAARRYPPIITGVNTRPTDGTLALSCPAAGARVETKGGPTFEYLGTTDTPDLCRMRIGGEEVQAWYGIWLTSWPGADNAHPALKQVVSGRTGDVVGFDVRMGPGYAYHDLLRNEGIERVKILDATYQAMRLSHYREGFEGNTYRSVATAWKDMATGMILYSTYQHISGTPVIDDPLIPTAIVPAAR
ncbi:MAG: hypothetical protein ACRYHQ_32630 [Janthinobacterium lividum]